MQNPNPDPHAALLTALSTTARKMRTLFDSRVRERGLTLARARALLLLAENREWNQRGLAEALDIEQPSAVRLLDGMEKQGLVFRTSVTNDRRAKHIKLTDAAQVQLREIQEIVDTIRRELLEDLEPEDLAATLRIVQAISRTVETALAGTDR